MPMFENGRIYNRRREIHDVFNGQLQGGISTPAEHPLIFIFSSDSGDKHGYHDGPQSDGTYWYYGEGQRGDQQLTRGNRSVANHVADGKALHLFQQESRGMVRYEGEYRCENYHYERGKDTEGNDRRVIVFELHPLQ